MKRNSFNVLFFIKKAKLLKNGAASVCMRITVNGARVENNIRMSIEPALWNQAKECAKGKSRKACELNLYIEQAKIKLRKLFDELRDIHKNKELNEADTMRYIKQPDGISYDVYSLEMIIAIAFKICSKGTLLFRRFVIDEICATKKGSPVTLFFSCGKGSNLWYS